MEQQIQKKVIEFTKRNQDRIAEEAGVQSSFTEEDMKSYLQEVIREIQNARKGNNWRRSDRKSRKDNF
jgi:PAB1-binding protein PBP1